jgi:hypothetical protein
MAVRTLVIEVNASSAQEVQDSINAVLAASPIIATDYLESVVIAHQETNQKAMIVIWYDDGS